MPEESNPGSICPTCGSQIPASAAAGLCPSCVLRESQLKEQNFNAPSVEEIAAAFPDLEVLSLIGRGGMGAVYHARQPKLNREIALKVLLPDVASDPAFAERFSREARALAKLNHPNIVSLYEFGERDGLFFLAMELVDGVNLRQAMDAGRFTPEQALAIIPGICNALEAAHSLGILHRDIKPENILLDRDGEVKIVDFGIARMAGDSATNFTLTEIGAVLGSRQYMAPEQLEQAHAIDHRADIYSLGVVFYEMLTGELPIGRFLAPSEKSNANATIDEIVLRTLEKELDRRFQSVTQVRTEVQSANVEPDLKPAAAGRSGEIIGIPTFTFWANALCVFGGLLAGIFGVLSDGLPFVVAIVPIVVGLILILLGQAGCWLALAAIRRGQLSPVGRGWLQFFVVIGPIIAVIWSAALGSAELFHAFGKGCVCWVVIAATVSTSLVTFFAAKLARIELGSKGRGWFGGIAAFLGIGVLAFTVFVHDRWPFAHMKLSAELRIYSAETEEDHNLVRSAIESAFGDRSGAYKVWLDEMRSVVHVTVLNSERSPVAATKHIEAYTQRVLDLLPARLVEESRLQWGPRRLGHDAFGIWSALFSVALVAGSAAAGFALLGSRVVVVVLPTVVIIFGVIAVLPGLPYSKADGSLVVEPPLPPLASPEIQADFSTPETAAATLMEATIRGDIATMRRSFSSEWPKDALEKRIQELTDSFDEKSRILEVRKTSTRHANLFPVTVEVVRRDGGGTGRYATAFALEEGEWKVSVPR